MYDWKLDVKRLKLFIGFFDAISEKVSHSVWRVAGLVSDEEQTAVEVRKLAEQICLDVMLRKNKPKRFKDKNGNTQEANNLGGYMRVLEEARLVDKEMINLLHRFRGKGNGGAHISDGDPLHEVLDLHQTLESLPVFFLWYLDVIGRADLSEGVIKLVAQGKSISDIDNADVSWETLTAHAKKITNDSVANR